MSKKDEIKRLWKECFGDSPEYIDMYFSRIYSEESTLTAQNDEGRTVSMLQLMNYNMLFCNKQTELCYIGGAATARKCRGQGHMTRLMIAALDQAADRGAMMCALIPAHGWLYFFFERFGFSNVYLTDRQCYTSFHPFATEATYHSVTDNYAPEVIDAFDRYERLRPGGVIHSRRDFLNILDDLSFRDNGTFVAVGRAETPVAGMAWGFDNGEFIQVNELLGIDHDARTGALQALRSHFPGRPFTVLAPADDHTGRQLRPRGMGRIVNVKKCLDLIAENDPDWRCRIRVTDPLLEHNSHIFNVANGICSITDTSPARLDFDVSIDVFTRIVFSSPATGAMLGFPSRRTHIALMLH